jgi:hypothetical protein
LASLLFVLFLTNISTESSSQHYLFSTTEWKLYSHFLKKQTHREATNILRNEDNGRDLSDVLQQLLEEWLTRQKKQ